MLLMAEGKGVEVDEEKGVEITEDKGGDMAEDKGVENVPPQRFLAQAGKLPAQKPAKTVGKKRKCTEKGKKQQSY